jgi:large subunit ribosomal protein L24
MANEKTKFEKKFKVKSNDMVVVTTGKHKGQTGKVKHVDRENDRVTVSGVNILTVNNKRTGRVQKEAPIHISNVSHFVEIDGKVVPSKVRFETVDGNKTRVLAKTGKPVGEAVVSKAEKVESVKENKTQEAATEAKGDQE